MVGWDLRFGFDLCGFWGGLLRGWFGCFVSWLLLVFVVCVLVSVITGFASGILYFCVCLPALVFCWLLLLCYDVAVCL